MFTLGADGFMLSLSANQKSFGRRVCTASILPDKTKKLTYAPSKDSDQPEPSVIRHEITLGPLLSLEHIAETLIRQCQYAGPYPPSLGKCVVFVDFVVLWLISYFGVI